MQVSATTGEAFRTTQERSPCSADSAQESRAGRSDDALFMALILQAVIERQVRKSMDEHAIDAVDIYPEHRLSYHSTTAKIFDRFRDTSLYRLMQGKKLIKQYQDEITSTQKKVMPLLGMTVADYWGSVI